LIAGFLQPASGKILLDGNDIVDLAPEQRPVSILFQSDNLFDHLSVEKNLELGLAKNPVAKISNIQNALEQVGLMEFIDRSANFSLSCCLTNPIPALIKSTPIKCAFWLRN